MEKQFKIGEKLAMSILNYLGRMPYVEVTNFIAGLQQLEVIEIKNPEPPKDNDSFISLQAQQKVDTTWTDPLAYIDDGGTTIT